MARYVDSKVWLRISGAVQGWELEDLNRYIDKWNSPEMKYIRSLGDFWGWLSYECGYEIYGFADFWRSKLDSQVHRIKEG